MLPPLCTCNMSAVLCVMSMTQMQWSLVIVYYDDMLVNGYVGWLVSGICAVEMITMSFDTSATLCSPPSDVEKLLPQICR